jgi:hypothetical protein
LSSIAPHPSSSPLTPTDQTERRYMQIVGSFLKDLYFLPGLL